MEIEYKEKTITFPERIIVLVKANIDNLKQLMPTKADVSGRDLTKFYIVYPGDFVFNHRTSRNGSKFSIAFNDGDEPVICTEDYVVFRVKEEYKDTLHARWLYMYFNRPEFDRYVITNSWGSSTEFYNWEDICEVEFVLPEFSVQQKYVNVYDAMLSNQRSYECGLEDLKLTVDVLLDRYKKVAPKRTVGELLEDIDVRNTGGEVSFASGINITKQFMPSVASSDDLTKYKLVAKNQFAYSAMQTGRDECIRIALQTQDEKVIVSPAYSVLRVKDPCVLAEYVMMWFSRKESDRLGWFMSDASVRANLDLDRFYEIEIPVPTLDAQQSLVAVYNAYTLRRRINEQLKNQIKDLCPILIKGSIEEASA